MPIALTDNQLSIIMRNAEPLQAADRDAYLHRVAELLHDVEIDDGAVALAARQAQSELFRAPDLFNGTGVPRPERKTQRRTTSAV